MAIFHRVWGIFAVCCVAIGMSPAHADPALLQQYQQLQTNLSQTYDDYRGQSQAIIDMITPGMMSQYNPQDLGSMIARDQALTAQSNRYIAFYGQFRDRFHTLLGGSPAYAAQDQQIVFLCNQIVAIDSQQLIPLFQQRIGLLTQAQQLDLSNQSDVLQWNALAAQMSNLNGQDVNLANQAAQYDQQIRDNLRAVYNDLKQRITQEQQKDQQAQATAQAAAQAAAHAAPATTKGFVLKDVKATGSFYIATADGRRLDPKELTSATISDGARLVTGADGHVQLTLPDETTFTAGPDTNIVLDSFVYSQDDSLHAATVSLTKGIFRWVTGALTNSAVADLKIKLPAGIGGIRGTDFIARVNADGSGTVKLYSGKLELTETKGNFTFILSGGQQVAFGKDGVFGRPRPLNKSPQ